MLLNQIAEEVFSAIAASFNNAFNTDSQKRRFVPLLLAG